MTAASCRCSGRSPMITLSARLGLPERVAQAAVERHVAERRVQGVALDPRREQVDRGRADEAGDEQVGRLVVELLGVSDLLEHAAAHHRDAVPERHRLDLVVRDVDRRDVRARCCRRFSSVRICMRSLASRLESGSSIRNAFGSRTIARPIATRWRWPPESCAGLRSRMLGEVEDLGRLSTALVDLGLLDLALLAARRPCSRAPSCAGTARSSGRPSRCRGPWAGSR